MPTINLQDAVENPITAPDTATRAVMNSVSQLDLNNTRFYLQNFFQPELVQLSQMKNLGAEKYMQMSWLQTNQWWLLGGAVGLFGLVMLTRGRR